MSCASFHYNVHRKKKTTNEKVPLRSSYSQITFEGLNVLQWCTICWSIRQKKKKTQTMEWDRKNERTFKFWYFRENSASHKQFSKLLAVMVGVYYFYTELVKCLTENSMHVREHLYSWLQFRCFQWTYVQLLISLWIYPDACQATNEWFHELSHLFSTILKLIQLKIAIPQIHSGNRLWLKCAM